MNKVAVVTGASSGIGKAIVETLLKDAYNILGNGRTINSIFESQSNLVNLTVDYVWNQ